MASCAPVAGDVNASLWPGCIMSEDFRTSASRVFTAAWPTVNSAVAASFAWVGEHAPLFGRRAVSRRNRVVVGPYARTPTLATALLWTAAIPAGLLLCIVYGFFFGVTAPYMIVPCLVPIALMAGLIIWGLPDARSAPTLQIEFLTAAYFVCKIVWPNYLAISLPGLPWISILRIIGLPLAIFLLISISTSKPFRRYAYESVSSIKLLLIFLIGFSIVQVLTIPVSDTPLASAQIVFDQFVNFTMIFVLGSIICRKEGMAERYMALLCSLSVFCVVLTAIEFKRQHILWADHIPDILHPRAPSVENTLRPSFRMYINVYRAKGTFATGLALAEFISLTTPFFIYFALSNRRMVLRIFCIAMVPMTFLAVRMTDARLGVVGVFGTVLVYGLIWSIARWRARPRDLFAAAIVYAYPAVFIAAVGAILTSTRLSTMVFGGGAQASSTEARATQLGMAAEAFFRRPWGYGAGQAGPKMGFAKDAFVTIDNFFISVQLDYGLLGIVFWYGMFLCGIIVAIFHCLSDRYAGKPEARLLVPLAASLLVFLIIKWVHGQDENHSIYFLMLGMISALVYRLRHNPGPADMQGSKTKH